MLIMGKARSEDWILLELRETTTGGRKMMALVLP